MTDFAIKVEKLSKQFRIGLKDELHETFIGKISSIIKKPVDNFRKISYLNKFHKENNQEDIFWALKDISMEFKYGKVTGLIGPNGAGKTTLLKIISKITAPSSGRILINGRVGSLLEVGTGFHPDLTGRENVYLNGTILGMKKNISTLIVLSPALTAVEKVICKQIIGRPSKGKGSCRNLDPGFEVFYNYFSKMMNIYRLPHIDFLKSLVDYSKENELKFLYRNKGQDIHHYSPRGNFILAKSIANRIKIIRIIFER